MKIEMPKLQYAANTLEPIISEHTIGFHYGKHLQTYVNALISLVKNTEFENMTVEDIIRNASNGAIFNNAGQIFNHTFYFMQLSAPKKNNVPQGRLAQLINDAFGNFEEFQKLFTQAATTLFGSGWAWLSQDAQGNLVITKDQNANCPLTQGLNPLFVVDVWEHAYYLDYQNRRADYVAAIWDVVDWSVVERRLK